MATQLIFTVGKNALPIWVAWKHLKDLKDEAGECVLQPPLTVWFVYTTETEPVMDRLKKRCQACDSSITYHNLPTEAGDPKVIRDVIEGEVIKSLPHSGGCVVHVHYTGGTKVMGVETVRAHEYGLSSDCELITSYLDPRADSGATIVDCNSTNLVEDARKEVFLELEDIAYLNGFKLGDFSHTYKYWNGSDWEDKTIYCQAPQEPTTEELAAGCAVLDNIRDLHYTYQDRRQDNMPKPSNKFSHDFIRMWKDKFGRREFVHPGSCQFNPLGNNEIREWWEECSWKSEVLVPLNAAYRNCQWNITTGELCIPTATDEDHANDLKEMDAFFRSNKWFEYAAYSAFKQALEEIGCKNFKLYQNVFVRKVEEEEDASIAPFELDVVAVLGYQVVVVSCSVSSGKGDIKQKAMEAYHRAILLGGEEARAVVLCVADQQDAENIQKDVARDTGTEQPLQIWGKVENEEHDLLPTTNQLKKKFEELLNELRWT